MMLVRAAMIGFLLMDSGLGGKEREKKKTVFGLGRD